MWGPCLAASHAFISSSLSQTGLQISQACGLGEADPLLLAPGLDPSWFKLISTSLVSSSPYIDWQGRVGRKWVTWQDANSKWDA